MLLDDIHRAPGRRSRSLTLTKLMGILKVRNSRDPSVAGNCCQPTGPRRDPLDGPWLPRRVIADR